MTAMAKTEIIESPYQSLSSVERDKALRLNDELNKAEKHATEAFWDYAAVARLNYELWSEYGLFEKWIAYEGKCRATIYKMLNVDKFCLSVGHDLPVVKLLNQSSVYELAKPSTPAPAIKEVIKQAKTGKAPSAAEVKAIVKKHKPPNPRQNDNPQTSDENGKPKRKAKVVERSSAKLADAMIRAISPLVRQLDMLAETNGGKGKWHKKADDALNAMIGAVKEMRKGER
jgi:hypothetical protein